MNDPQEQASLLERTYGEIDHLRTMPNQFLRLRDLGPKSGLPNQGVYLFFEDGETRPDGTPRVVRVGTHAVSEGSRRTLWQRLSNHLGTRAGAGNHRGSIFRLHVGAALLRANDHSLSFWGVGSSRPLVLKSNPEQLQAELEWEHKVSETIGSMRVMWLSVPGDSSKDNQRRFLETNLIALFSNHRKPLDTPSTSWLGLHSPREVIRESGLWNLDSINGSCSPDFERTFRDVMGRMLRT